MVTKKCKVAINKQGGLIEADLYGVFQRSFSHGDSLLVGGHKAGHRAYPVAIVDWGEGLKEVSIEVVKEIMGE